MKKKRLFLLILVCIFMVAGCSSGVSGVKRYNIATASTGGSFYPAGVALAQLLSENILNKQFSASSTAGSVENITLLKNNESHLAFIQSNVLMDAYTGINSFDGEEPFENLRIISPIATTVHHIVVRKDSNIKSISDLKGKRFVTGRPGSGSALTSEIIFKVFNIDLNDIIAEALGQAEAADALKNGQVDGAMLDAALGNATLTELKVSTGNDIEILSFTPEEIELLIQTYPWMVPIRIPSNTYPNQSEELLVSGHLGYLVTTEEIFSEEEVYSMLNIIFDHKEYLIETQSSFNNPAFIQVDEFLDNPVPLHDGAIKYFKEIGALN